MRFAAPSNFGLKVWQNVFGRIQDGVFLKLKNNT
jgi:hypothetical protein